MKRVVEDFDYVQYRERLKDLLSYTNAEAEKLHGTLEAICYNSMSNAFKMALQKMEEYTIFKEV